MKKLVYATMVALGLNQSLSAQDVKPANENNRPVKQLSVDDRVKNNTRRAEKDLGLSADQKSKWEAAARERLLANEPIQQKLKGSTIPEERTALKQQIKANNDKFDAAVGGFLTPEQKTKFDAMKNDRMNRRGGHRHGPPGGNDPGKTSN